MQIIGLQTPVIKPDDDLPEIILGAAGKVSGFKDGDVLVIASSAVATAQGNLRKLAEVEVSEQAKKLSKESGLDARFVEVVLQEADRVLSAGEMCLLTLEDGMIRVNAGVDRTNAPPGHVVLTPRDVEQVAGDILRTLQQQTGKKIGVIIADSHIQPLRLGTVGQAIATAGLKPVIDCRKQQDLYGRPLRMTFRAVADQLASAAQVVMGEAAERAPAVIARGTGVRFSRAKISPKIEPRRCIYASLLESDGDMGKS
jgi:coenzyme F420-0:L-glutamate ligase